MRFMQTSTRTVLEPGSEDAAEIMRVSDAYTVMDDGPTEEVLVPDGSNEGHEDGRRYSKDELEDMTVSEIRAVAEDRGYTIGQGRKAELIEEFLAAQLSDTQE